MELPLLQRREVEARILAPVLQAMMDRYGRQEVADLVAETIQRLAREHGADVARSMDGNALKQMPGILSLWKQDGALETEMVRQDTEHFDFNVTRCRFAEMYERLGIRDLGAILSCNRDFCFIEGFNPAIKLTRTQTIMEGASHCDFRFHQKGQRADAQPPESGPG